MQRKVYKIKIHLIGGYARSQESKVPIGRRLGNKGSDAVDTEGS